MFPKIQAGSVDWNVHHVVEETKESTRPHTVRRNMGPGATVATTVCVFIRPAIPAYMVGGFCSMQGTAGFL